MTVSKFKPSHYVHMTRNVPAATFTVNGTLNFNRELSVTIPDGFTHCELMLDDDPEQLLIKLFSDQGEDTVPLRVYRGYYTISIRRFLLWAGWDRDVSRVFQARYVDRARAVVISLRKPLATSGGRQRDCAGRFTGFATQKTKVSS